MWNSYVNYQRISRQSEIGASSSNRIFVNESFLKVFKQRDYHGKEMRHAKFSISLVTTSYMMISSIGEVSHNLYRGVLTKSKQ